jgi:hypothetical protein
MNDKPVPRNPRQNYLEMGLQIGDRLIFDGLEQEVVTVAGPHTLLWDDTEYYLTKLRGKLGPLVGRKAFSTNKILALNGRKLDDLYYSLH